MDEKESELQIMAIFQTKNHSVHYQAHSGWVEADTVLLIPESKVSASQWSSLLERWKSAHEAQKNGRLCCVEIPDKVEDVDGFVQVLNDLISGLNLQPVDLVTDPETTSFGLALAAESGTVGRLAILDPTPIQWDDSLKKVSLKDLDAEVLILHGAFDSNSPKAGAKELVKSLPRAKMQELKTVSADKVFEELNQFFISIT